MADKSKNEMDEREIGALWTRESNTDGKKFWSGSVTINGTEHKIVMFKNSFKKEGDNQPSLRIYKDRPNPNEKPKAEDDFPE